MKLIVYTDGGARGNPGISGVGVYIKDETGKCLEKRYKSLGIKTNNEAEYLGAYFGIKRAIELGANEIELFMDSRLIINQLNGEWKVKKNELKKIYNDIINETNNSQVKLTCIWIKREDNKEADRLSNIAMDSY